jgi:hypothetical protein
MWKREQGKAARDALTYVRRPTSEISSRKQKTNLYAKPAL